MIDFKNIFSLHYHFKLIEIFIKASFSGTLSANILGPLITAIILYDFIPHIYIYYWLLLHSIIFFARIFIVKKLLYILTIDSLSASPYLLKSLILSASTALLYAVPIWISILSEVPDLYIFMVAIVIFSLLAGSISTLGSILHFFIVYIFLSTLPLIAALLYHGGEVFNLFALVLTIFAITLTVAGYKQFIVLRNAILLDETFKTIYEKSTDGIILIKNNRFEECNEAIVKMFQYQSKEEFLNTHISQLMPNIQPDGHASIKKMLKMSKITFSEGNNHFEWYYTKKNGIPFWTEVVLTKINLNGEELIHGIWREISSRKKLEAQKEAITMEIEQLYMQLESKVKEEVEKNRKKDQQLLQHSRLAQMGEMISMIAHQWRQPLAAISATSASIELKASMHRLDNDTAQKKAQDISNFSQHLSSTIDDFRNFFKPDKQKEETSYKKVITSVLEIIGISISNKNIKLVQNLNSYDTFISYPNELKQVILNLIKNSEDVLSEKQIENPCIKISSYKKNNKHILEVSDNAGGIPEEIIEKIFDPYFSTKKEKEGTGLGLYMSKTIIEEHCGGELSVSNSHDGVVFKIQLSEED